MLDSFSKKPFKILYMTQDGLFFTPNHKSLMITIKHVLQVQRFLHKNVTNREVDEFAKKLGFDPAVMASPFITTIVDAISLMIYFQIAIHMLSF